MDMSIGHRFLLSLCSLALCLPGGCEDAAARRRGEVQQAIIQASEKLNQAAVSAHLTESEAQGVRATLQEVVRELSAVDETDATQGQKAARALLIAAASRSLASIDMDEAGRIESALRRERSVIHGRIDAAMRLHGIAAARATVEDSSQRSLLQAALTEAEAAYAQFATYADQLNEPISSITRENQQFNERARALRQQADEQYRRAAELGAADGFPSFETAISYRIDADKIDARIARNEIQLGYDLQAEHDFAAVRMQQSQAMIDSIRSSLGDLDGVAQSFASEAGKIREDVVRLSGEIGTSLETVSEQAAGRLNELYERIEANLDRAAAQARRGSGGDTADSARLAGARAHEMAGQAAGARAQALADHAAVLERLIDAGGALGSVQKFRTELQAVSAKRTEAIERAKSSYGEARDLLGQASSRGPDSTAIDAFRTNIEQQIARLDGRAVEPSPPPTTPDAAMTSSPAAGGFASPEQAIEAMVAASRQDRGASTRLMSAFHAETSMARAMLQMMNSVSGPMLDLEQAMTEQFGPDALQQSMGAMGGMTSGMEAVTNPQILDRGDDYAVVGFQNQAGESAQLNLVEVDGGWFIDMDSLLAAGGDQNQIDAMVQSGMSEEQALAALQSMSAGMSRMLTSLAQRVRAGEFASADEVGQAMMQGVFGAMAEGGGMPDGG